MTATQLELLESSHDDVIEAYREGASVQSIADKWGVRRQTVTSLLTMHSELKQGSRTGARLQRVTEVREWVRDHPGASLPQIADAFGLHPTTISDYLRGSPERALVVDRRGVPQQFSDDDTRASMEEAWRKMTPAEQAQGLSKKRYDRIVKELSKADGRRRPSAALLLRRWESWSAACAAAGLRSMDTRRTNYTRAYSDQDCIDAVRRFIAENDETSYAAYITWAREDETAPSGPTVMNRLGTWAHARTRAIEEPEAA